MSTPTSPSPLLLHLKDFLQTRQPPKTFCPSEVVRALSPAELRSEHADSWRTLMPRCREFVWQLRDAGELQVLQRGQVLDNTLHLEDVTGPIRVRRVVVNE